MEKVINIDGKDITFKSKAVTPLLYKAQFKRDLFADLMKLSKIGDILSNDNSKEDDLDGLDFEIFYNIAWVLAKTADRSIPEPIKWFDYFENFPLFDILPELQEMVLSTMQSSKKKAK